MPSIKPTKKDLYTPPNGDKRYLSLFHIELSQFRWPVEHQCPKDGLPLVDYVSLVSSQASLRQWCHTWEQTATILCTNGETAYYTLIWQIRGLFAINSGTMSSKRLSRFSMNAIYNECGGQTLEPEPILQSSWR